MNKIIWKKYSNNPIPSLSAKPGTWREGSTMTVDAIDKGDKWQIFYVGKENGQDSIGIATIPKEVFDGFTWEDYSGNPILKPGESGSYDSQHLVDPSAVEWNSQIYLYYSALGNGPDSIGLAISDDGVNFKKEEKPVLIGRAPEVVKFNNLLYMFYSVDNPNGGYEFHLATSSDGLNFNKEGAILMPSNSGWDSLSIVTPRIFYEDGIFIMSYAGDDKEKDFPTEFGLAFSKDLRQWKKYSNNPVFSGGAPSSWESKAIWFPEILKVDDIYYMWYEGHDGNLSQVGLATTKSPLWEIAHEELGD